MQNDLFFFKSAPKGRGSALLALAVYQTGLGGSVGALKAVFCLFAPAQSDFVSLAEMEDALLRNLFQGYQRWVRPIQHANDTIKVRFGLKISQLVDVVRQPTRRSSLLFSTSQLENTFPNHFPPIIERVKQLKCRLSSFILCLGCHRGP